MKLQKNPSISYARLSGADKKMQRSTETKRAIIGSIISLLAGLLILIQGIVRLVRAEWALDFGFGEIPRRFFGATFLTTRGIFAVVFGIIVLLGAFLISRPGKEMAGGILVLVFSAMSIIAGGGFLVGFVLGVIGGILGLVKK
jgi:uncharacterized membrane protein YidH (DUF202 family)